MKNKKWIAAFALAACLGLMLTACSGKNDPNSNVKAEEQSQTTTEGESSKEDGTKGASGQTEGSKGSSAASDESKPAGESQSGESQSGESQSQGESQTQSQKPAEDFTKLLASAKNINELYDFLDANIERVKDDEADTMVIGLLGFARDPMTLDQDRLDEYSNYTNPEVTEYIYMLDLELENPSRVNGKIVLSLDDMVGRAGEGEFYLQQYPDSPLYQEAYDLYYQWISDAITGGFDAQSGAANQFAGADGTIPAADVEYLADFAEGNDSVNGQLIYEYAELLKANGNQINDAVKAFYAALPQKVKDMY